MGEEETLVGKKVVAVTMPQIVLKLSINDFLGSCHYSDSCVIVESMISIGIFWLISLYNS